MTLKTPETLTTPGFKLSRSSPLVAFRAFKQKNIFFSTYPQIIFYTFLFL
jgi:hypothetical protein